VRLTVDTDAGTVEIVDGATTHSVPLYSDEAFDAISRQWVKVGWVLKYAYGFSWMGRPIIQLPEDLVRIQEVIYRVKPDVIVETGVAHGGSLVFYAGLCRAMGAGRVVGIDIEIRSDNRHAIEAHELADLITLVEGSSTDPDIVRRVKDLVGDAATVLVLLDSNHTRDHVAAELEAYAPLVSPGSYIVATDGIMTDLHDAPRGAPEWRDDNPLEAARQFVARHPEFVLDEPLPREFDESETTVVTTHWPGAYLRRVG
jgi:cephalosporin hydroxylase